MSPKVPRRPPEPLTVQPRDLPRYNGPLWRIHATGGLHPTRWDEPRTFGPVDSRWDPHPEPRGEHPAHGVLYAATDPTTAFGEVFQRRRAIDRFEGDRHLTGWRPARELTLLDITDNWPARQGAAAALSAAPKSTCRAWARAIFDELAQGSPHVDGIWALSTITGRPVVALFDRPDAYPDAPEMSRPLHHDGLLRTVDRAVAELNFGLVEPPPSHLGALVATYAEVISRR